MSWPDARPRPARVSRRLPLAAFGGAIIAGAMTSAVMFGSAAPEEFVTRDDFGGRPVIAGTPKPTVPPTTTPATTATPTTEPAPTAAPITTRTAQSAPAGGPPPKPTTTPRPRPTGSPTKTTPSCRPAPHCG